MNVSAPRLQSQWDWRATGNFIGGGTGTGLYVFVTLDYLAGIPQPWLSLLALALIAGGLSLVLLEIGRPWRFLNVIFHPQTSWMTREALVAVPFMIFGLAGAWFGWRTLLVVAAVCGIGFLYCQARILHSAKGIPAWRTPKIVPLMITTGLCEGAGLFLAVGYFLSPASPGITTIIAVYALLTLIVSRDDPTGDDPLIRNGEARFLVGYEQELARNFTLGAQYYLERMLYYAAYRETPPPGVPPRDELRRLVTVRTTWLTMNQNLVWSLFAFYSPTDRDSYLRPKVSSQIDDHWSTELGGNVFRGEGQHTFFGQFENNSNAFAALRYGY